MEIKDKENGAKKMTHSGHPSWRSHAFQDFHPSPFCLHQTFHTLNPHTSYSISCTFPSSLCHLFFSTKPISQFKEKLQLALVVPEQYHHPFPLSFTDNVEKLVFFPFFSITKSPTEFSKSTSLEALQHLIIYSQQWLIS